MVLDSFALTGRVAFVTGAGSGIGQRLAAAFAEFDLIVDGGYVCW